MADPEQLTLLYDAGPSTMPLINFGAREEDQKARWHGRRQQKELFASESSPEESHSFITHSLIH